MVDFAKEVVPVDIEEEMKQSYLDYAMSVIVGRALPDVRDGLKPVHRRVLHAMRELGNDWNKPYKKSARVVGDTIGKYHPHGEGAVYDALVRMAQPFSMRVMLIDGQGNFGSVDGDPPAAMRYTEVRKAKVAHELLADIDKETVDFVPNYDGSEVEPSVFPTRFPNLLVNGSSGIAVGMATNIPPHNLAEVVDVCVALIDDPELGVDEIMEIMPGPDFPTAGIINGAAGIHEAYRTGRGRIYVRARAGGRGGRRRSSRAHRRQRASVPGEQGAVAGEDRGAGEGEADRGYLGPARRVRQGRDARRRRAAPRRERGGDAEQPVPAHLDGDGVRHQPRRAGGRDSPGCSVSGR